MQYTAIVLNDAYFDLAWLEQEILLQKLHAITNEWESISFDGDEYTMHWRIKFNEKVTCCIALLMSEFTSKFTQRYTPVHRKHLLQRLS
jgi:hypothetical protein